MKNTKVPMMIASMFFGRARCGVRSHVSKLSHLSGGNALQNLFTASSVQIDTSTNGFADSAGQFSEEIFVRRVQSSCYSTTPLSIGDGEYMLKRCFDVGLQSFSPESICGLADAFARQALVYPSWTAAAMQVLENGPLARVPPVALRKWLEALVVTRAKIPVRHFELCLSVLSRPNSSSHDPEVASALLRTLLLADLQLDDRTALRANGLVGRLLSAVAGGRRRHVSAALFGSKPALADSAWLVKHRSPPWLLPLVPHHAAILEAATFERVPAAVQHDNRAENGTEHAIRLALSRLRCEPKTGAVGHLQVPLVVPKLRLAIEFVGTTDELRNLEEEGSEKMLSPFLEMRHAQLQHFGWSVIVVNEAEWPAGGAQEEEPFIFKQQEFFLRAKLASSLQNRVPRSRRTPDLR